MGQERSLIIIHLAGLALRFAICSARPAFKHWSCRPLPIGKQFAGTVKRLERHRSGAIADGIRASKMESASTKASLWPPSLGGDDQGGLDGGGGGGGGSGDDDGPSAV